MGGAASDHRLAHRFLHHTSLRRVARALAARRDALVAPARAVALDAVRALTGLLAAAYFARQLTHASAYYAADGLLPHGASRAAFWFTAQPLFSLGATVGWARACLGLGLLASLALAAGVAQRVAAALAYVVAVCAYRHCFLLLSVDDALVHLLLFWQLVLPRGGTLRPLACLRARDRRALLRDEAQRAVRGLAPRLLLANLALVYAVAGLTKLRSPLWRSGDALYATLRLPCSYVAPWVPAAPLAALRALGYAALVAEPLFALGVLFSKGPRARAALAVGLAGFHLALALTVDVAFANLGCLAVLPLVLLREPPAEALVDARPERGREALGALALALLVGAMGSASLGRERWRAPRDERLAAPRAPHALSAEVGEGAAPWFFSALWCLGLAQQYRLLDWIDERNVSVALRFEGVAEGLRVEALAPGAMRRSLLLSYLGGVTWMPVPAAHERPLREALAARLARHTCARAGRAGPFALVARYRREDPRRPGPERERVLVRGACAAGGAPLASLTRAP